MMASEARTAPPNPSLIFETLTAHQRTGALKAAIELDIFTAIGEGDDSIPALAKLTGGSERGIRILCDNLVIIGLLQKLGQKYALTPDSSLFLDRRSPACIASMANFLTLPELMDHHRNLADVIRHGHPAGKTGEVLDVENPMWVEFARSMAPMQGAFAEQISGILGASAGHKWKVLDIAAGHGLFGIALAKHNPNAEIYAQDWPGVLAVAKENARKACVTSRHHLLPGNAFTVDFGSGYNVILLTAFLHHFDPPTNEKLLRKIHDALAPNGLVATLEFVPNEDRVSPPGTAAFSLTMLGGTPLGDAYPMSEYEKMFRAAGFSKNELHPLQGPQSLIVSYK
jgi:2-polyprenyl-3-methyl-5-hydroxy-6-metoxy-1,4-benzoquinol methylase